MFFERIQICVLIVFTVWLASLRGTESTAQEPTPDLLERIAEVGSVLFDESEAAPPSIEDSGSTNPDQLINMESEASVVLHTTIPGVITPPPAKEFPFFSAHRRAALELSELVPRLYSPEKLPQSLFHPPSFDEGADNTSPEL